MIDNRLLESKLREIDFLESFEVKKIYPNIIKLRIKDSLHDMPRNRFSVKRLHVTCW